MFVALLVVASLPVPPPLVTSLPGTLPLAWILESEQYAKNLQLAAPGWRVQWCSHNGSLCAGQTSAMNEVHAAVGRADALDLTALPNLKLVQSPSWYPVDGASVPARAAICNFDIWPTPYSKTLRLEHRRVRRGRDLRRQLPSRCALRGVHALRLQRRLSRPLRLGLRGDEPHDGRLAHGRRAGLRQDR